MEPLHDKTTSLTPQEDPRESVTKKKNARKIVLPIVIALLLAAAVAMYFLFFNETPIDEIRLAETTLTMQVGDVYPLAYEITPDDATELELLWKSDNESVATVRDGMVTAVAEGACTITVTAESGAQALCEITVVLPMAEEDARLLGRWNIAMTFFDGDLQEASDTSSYMLLNEDMTGVFYLNDSVYQITNWGFQMNSSSSDLYTVEMENFGTVSFGYATDPSGSLYGKLLLILDAENILIFAR